MNLEHEIGRLFLKYTSNVSNVLNGRQGQNVNEELDLPFFTTFVKNIDSISGVGLLLTSSPIENIYYSISATLRGNLLNGLICLNIASKIKHDEPDENQDEVKKRIQELYNDQLDFFWKDIRFMCENVNGNQIEEASKSINNKYGDRLKQKLNPIDKALKFKIKKRGFNAKFIAKESESAYYKLSLRLIDHYIVYSKMEHLGLLTWEFHSEIYNNKKTCLDRIVDTVYSLVKLNSLIKGFLRISNANEEVITSAEKILSMELYNRL